MKIKNGFVLERVGGSYLACATGRLASEFSGLVRLNDTGAFLWNLLASENLDEEALTLRMLEKYDVTRDIAAQDISLFISNLRNNGILDE